MGTVRIWEGVRNWDGGVDDFVWREFEGELIGVWNPYYFENEYFVYLLEDGRVVVWIYQKYDSGAQSANIYEHNDLDEAADAGFDEALYLMDVKGCHKVIETWRKTFPFRSAVDFLLDD